MIHFESIFCLSRKPRLTYLLQIISKSFQQCWFKPKKIFLKPISCLTERMFTQIFTGAFASLTCVLSSQVETNKFSALHMLHISSTRNIVLFEIRPQNIFNKHLKNGDEQKYIIRQKSFMQVEACLNQNHLLDCHFSTKNTISRKKSELGNNVSL